MESLLRVPLNQFVKNGRKLMPFIPAIKVINNNPGNKWDTDIPFIEEKGYQTEIGFTH